MYKARFQFMKNVMIVPNHKILGSILLKSFYCALNTSSRGMENTITRGPFMILYLKETTDILDFITLTNQG